MLESKIQASIITHAKKQGYFVLKVVSCNVSGYPDVTLFKDGITIFIEVKSEKGVQSPLQKYTQKLLEEQGFKYYLVRSLQQLKQIL